MTMFKKALQPLSIVFRFAAASPRQWFANKNNSARTPFGISILVMAVLLSACMTPTPAVTSAPTAPPVTSTPLPTATPQPTATAQSTATPNPTATAAVKGTLPAAAGSTALDPCQLLTSQEASILTGASFGAGKEETLDGGAKSCTYGANTKNVLYVWVAQTKDVAGAQAAQKQFEADLQANLQEMFSSGLTFSPYPNFADAAITASLNLSAIDVTGSAFGFRKGTIFFGFSDLVQGGAAPTSAAMQAQATTVLGRLP